MIKNCMSCYYEKRCEDEDPCKICMSFEGYPIRLIGWKERKKNIKRG